MRSPDSPECSGERRIISRVYRIVEALPENSYKNPGREKMSSLITVPSLVKMKKKEKETLTKESRRKGESAKE